MNSENKELWSFNTPARFWLCQPDLPEDLWQDAIGKSISLLGLGEDKHDIESVLAFTLGEGRFGPNHWTLSLPKRIYYYLKPALPQKFTRWLRQIFQRSKKWDSRIEWPIDSHYPRFLWETMAQLLRVVPGQTLCIRSIWPQGFRYALVLTHDVETKAGQGFIRTVADMEESLGFRSSFNFVPEGYRIDMDLLDELRQRGFEIGIHGLKHDGMLFSSQAKFERCVVSINRYLRELGANGFRAPFTHRNPLWMQSLDIEYDLSFFDADPYEPMPGGTMSIWPFLIGHFVELPYTLVQDCTLNCVLGETTPRIWLEKVEFIAKYHGMVLVNSHPDYLKDPIRFDIYSRFLHAMREKEEYWHALPGEVARWWRSRCASSAFGILNQDLSKVHLDGENMSIEL